MWRGVAAHSPLLLRTLPPPLHPPPPPPPLLLIPSITTTTTTTSPSPLLRSSSPAPARLRRVSAAAAAAAAVQDAAAAALVMGGAYSLVLAFDKLSERHIVEQSLSRKIVHVLSGILFMSSWAFFSSSAEARYFAAIAPLLNCIRLLTYGLRLLTSEALIKSVTREGKPEMLFYFSCFGYIHLAWEQAIWKVALVSFAATLVESLPISDVLDDNISVPLASMLTAFLVFGSSPQ